VQRVELVTAEAAAEEELAVEDGRGGEGSITGDDDLPALVSALPRHESGRPEGLGRHALLGPLEVEGVGVHGPGGPAGPFPERWYTPGLAGRLRPFPRTWAGFPGPWAQLGHKDIEPCGGADNDQNSGGQ